MTLCRAFWKSVILGPIVAVALSGCGPGALEPSAEVDKKEDLGVTSQAIAYGGHDYLFVKTPKTWHEAQSLCSVNGYKLVTINDANEEAFLATHEAYFGLSNWWIGLNDLGSEGFFVWDGGFSSYTNWYPGEPNNNGGGEDCVVDRFSDPNANRYTEQWNDAPCSMQLAFICERDPAPVTNRGSYSYSASNTSSGNVGTSNQSVFLYAGQLFTVATCGVPGASGAGDTFLRVNNPSGQEIASNDDAGGACGYSSNISFVVPVTGSYTIRAGCWGSGSCSGTVAFNY